MRSPGFRSRPSASHSVSQRECAPPLALAMSQSGLYTEARGNLAETRRSPLLCDMSARIIVGVFVRGGSAMPFKIHPGLGVARGGDSPTEWFIGPETADEPKPPPGGYKDN